MVPITKRNNYRVYSPSKLSHAYHDVVEKNLSVYKAARIYNVPEQTLRDRINGRIDFETTRSGPSPIFSVEEEVRLVDHIKEIARVGYAYTRAEVVNVASEYAVCLGSRSSEKPLTLKWFYGFLGRWPELKVRRPKTISELRARATSPECIDSYFHELKNILDKYDLSSRPQSIYNVDEKGIQQNFKPPSVVSDVDSMPSVIMSERSATTTILGCGNALGQHIPPYFIFAGARMRQELLEGCTHGADGTVSQSGWSNGEIFKKYLEDHFLKFSTPRSAEKPLLLMYDGHRSHISPDIIDWANEHHIILYVLPPHTSHILQPMDVGCFGPFSKIYNNECLKFQREHGACVSRYNICSIACKAYAAALSPQNLQSSFSRSGIHPYSPGSIDVSHLVISKERRKFVQEQPSNEDQSEIQTEPEPELGDEQLGVEEEKNQEVDQQEGEMEKEDNCESNINQNTNAQTDKTEVTVKFFQKKRPVFVPPFKSQRRSISNIVAGKAITESEVSEKVKEYFQESATKSVKTASTKSVKTGSDKKAPKRKSSNSTPSEVTSDCPSKSKSKKKTDPKKTSLPKSKHVPSNSQVTPGPSGLQTILLSDSDVDSTQDDDDDEVCCVCNQFQPDALKRAVSLVFTPWGKCMYEGCDHWVHLRYCCNVTNLRRHDTFYCPCHGLPCKPVEE